MHRTDSSGHVNGTFTDGNPAIGQQATQVSAAWLNDIQENVAQVIEQSGLDLVKGDGFQLYDAIIALLAGVVGTGGGSVPTTRNVATAGLASGGGNLAADRTITVPKATPAEAAAGVRDDVAVTPLGLAGLIAVTGAAGVLVFKAGPFVLQAFSGVVSSNGTTILTLPESFPAECVAALVTGGNPSSGAQDNNPFVIGQGLSNVSIFNSEDMAIAVRVIAVGR
jgi:hypothetical protein